MTALIAFLYVNLDRLATAQEGESLVGSALPILLAVAGLAASLLVRPQEHELATRLLAILRWVIAVPAVSAFALAAVFAVGLDWRLGQLPALGVIVIDVKSVWTTLTCLSIGSVFLVTLTLFSPGRRLKPPA